MPRRPRPAQRHAAARDRVVSLSSGVDNLIAGHPWVFRDDAVRRLGTLPIGAEVDVHDARRGRFVARGLFEPEGPVAIRIFTRSQEQHFDEPYLIACLERAAALRQSWLDAGDTNAYRLVNAEADGLPGLVIERFGAFWVVQPYSDLWSTIPEPLIDWLEPRAERGVLLRSRQRGQSPKLAVLRGEGPPDDARIVEHGLEYVAFTQGGVKPGLYLDHRDTRQRLAPWLSGKRFVNAFSYTGGFTVAAARQDCESFNIDQSGWCHDVARENLRQNEARGKHHFITEDVFEALERWTEGEVDAVLLDPPAFSTSRRGVQSNKKDLARLVTLGSRHLVPGGLLMVASNEGRLAWNEFLSQVGRGAHRAERSLRVLGKWGSSVDFPSLPAFPEGDRLKILVATADRL